jgi:hypothetical protein
MTRGHILLYLLLLCNHVFADAPATIEATAHRLGLGSLSFTQNNGQWNEQALFRATAGGFTAWFAEDKIYYQFTRRIPSEFVGAAPRGCPEERVLGDHTGSPLHIDSTATKSISATFVGANPHPQVVGEGLMEYKCNYFIGNDPTEWHTDVPNYKAVVYKDIYPGIDLKYYGNGDGKIEYDFIISPNANPSQIAIRYDGADNVCVDDQGLLVVETEWGKMIERAPLVWQVIDGDVRELTAEYVQKEGGTFGFKLSDGYEPEYAVVVDPVLSYSTYLGGGGFEYCTRVAVDGNKDIYFVGMTDSYEYPVKDPYQEMNHGGSYGDDAFISKLGGSGTGLIYSTYFGGSGEDCARGIDVDCSGSAFLTGVTSSADFPIKEPLLMTRSGSFVTKLSSSGNELVYSTYIGGDGGEDIRVDKEGSAYIIGETSSPTHPTQNPFQAKLAGGIDAFVAKLSSSGDKFLYSTYLGGRLADRGRGIAIDSDGNAYVTGMTDSDDFPTQNPFQTISQDMDVFVAKLSEAGNELAYGTLVGGNNYDYGSGIAVDDFGNAYITGATSSSDFPTHDPYQSNKRGYYDAFVIKLCSAGNNALFSTFLGGNDGDFGMGIDIDAAGHIYVAGITSSTDYPLRYPLQTSHHGGSALKYDGFVTKIDQSGTSLIYSSFLGGSGDERCYSIVADDGNVYVAGNTRSNDFPTLDPFQETNRGYDDVFVTRINFAMCGDVDCDGTASLTDVVYLVNFLFVSGPAPIPVTSGDVACDGRINIADAVYLVRFLFSGGPEPCAGC